MTKMRNLGTASQTSGARSQRAADRQGPLSVEPAAIVGVQEDGRLEVRTGVGTGATRKATARLAHLPGYTPRPGDRVLVAQGPDELYAIAVLHVGAPQVPADHDPALPAPTPDLDSAPALALADGSSASVVHGAIEVKDPQGRLVVRYSNGTAEIAAPERDLVLRAPNGQVRFQAGTDIAFDATRDLLHTAGRRIALGSGPSAAEKPQLRVDAQTTSLRSDNLEVQSKKSRFVSGRAEVLLRTLATTAEKIAVRVTDHELTATRVVERAGEAFREVKDLLSTRAGRARTEVVGSLTFESGRTQLVSREETTVDGKKILLG